MRVERQSLLCLAFFFSFYPSETYCQTLPSNPQHPLTVTVMDENGMAVASALVVLQSGPRGAMHCETDFAGHCEFFISYSGAGGLHVQKRGYYALDVPNLQLGETKSVDAVLHHQQEIRETINVSEQAPVIDPAQVSQKEELTGLDIINLPYPYSRDYRNALNFIPGVVQDASGQPHIAGGDTHQTLTLLDGFNVSQPANGLLLIRVSTDAFRSVQVESSREPAEYGKASAGVLSLNTGIGDNHFRFIATDFTPSLQDKKGINLDTWTPRFTVSGPIIPGKMWFYDAIDGEYDLLVIPQLPNGQDEDPYWRIGNLAKIQTNLTSRNILSTEFVINQSKDAHLGLSPLDPLAATPADIESAYAGTVKDQEYFKSGELLEAGFGVSQYDLNLVPIGTTPYFITPETAGGNYYLNEQTYARRYQVLSNLYFPSHQWHGTHNVKIGVDLDRINYGSQFARQPASFIREGAAAAACATGGNGEPVIPTPCSRYSTFSGGQYSVTNNVETSGFAEDRWLITNRLLVEPGVRFDWDEIVRRPLFSPRLAGTYVFDQQGNTKISAGVDVLYDSTYIILIARPYAGARTDYFFNSLGDPTNLTGTQVAAPDPVLTTFSVDRSTLRAPRFISWSIGLEQKLPYAIYLKTQYGQRDGVHDFVYNTVNGAAGGEYVLQGTRKDFYRAFEIDLRRNFRENYLIMGSYIRSSTRSNQVLNFNVDSPILSPQAAGPFPWDVPNRFLTWGYIPFFSLPWIHKIDLAYSSEIRNGFAFDAVTDQQQLHGRPDSYRFPTYFTLNLQVEKRFHAFGYYWALRGGFDDITDRRNYLIVNNDINSPQFLTFSTYVGRTFESRIRFLGRK